MATPSYQGQQQPVANQGTWLRRVGSMFGQAATPAYAGNGQPSIRVRFLGKAAPAYASAPQCRAVDASVETSSVSCPIDPAALAAGQIAIVVPRKGC